MLLDGEKGRRNFFFSVKSTAFGVFATRPSPILDNECFIRFNASDARARQKINVILSSDVIGLKEEYKNGDVRQCGDVQAGDENYPL